MDVRVGDKSAESVCLSVSGLTAEPFDIQTQNLVEALTLIISRISSKVKVIGQRSRSPHWKNVNFGLFDVVTCVDCADPFCYEILGYVMSRRDLTSFNDIKARILIRRARRGRAHQRSGIFILCIYTAFFNIGNIKYLVFVYTWAWKVFSQGSLHAV